MVAEATIARSVGANIARHGTRFHQRQSQLPNRTATSEMFALPSTPSNV
jgi:hypothetical protein